MPALARWLEGHTAAEAEELRKLIASQSHDDQTDRVRHRRWLVTAADLVGADGEPFALEDRATTPEPGPLVALIQAEALAALNAGTRGRVRPHALHGLIGANLVWDGSVVHYDPARGEPCPACGAVARFDRTAHCLVCSQSGDDPRQWPNKAPEETPRRSRKARLAGGVGKARVDEGKAKAAFRAAMKARHQQARKQGVVTA